MVFIGYVGNGKCNLISFQTRDFKRRTKTGRAFTRWLMGDLSLEGAKRKRKKEASVQVRILVFISVLNLTFYANA